MDVRFRSLDRWPHESTPRGKRRPRSTFRMPWNDTRNLLEEELAQLKARDIVVEVGIRPEDIRIDGWPRANAAEPAHPGVALYFESSKGPLRFATDAHEWWRHNLHAIALGLKALRAVDRYGITQHAEQYKGWAALPPGTDHALGVLFAAVGEMPRQLANGETEKLYRQALMAAHPDKGGTDEDARNVLDAGAALGLR